MGPSVHTPRAWWSRKGGFLYDSDAYNDDLPYWTMVGGKETPGDPRIRW